MEANQSPIASWPTKGYDGPQPWDLRALGISKDDIEELGPGQPNTLSPVKVRHSFPTLATGSQGPIVAELARRLHALGYPTDIGTGQNPYTVLTDAVLGAVQQFREEYGVREDPTAFGGVTQAAKDKAAGHVGPWTWEALLRAHEAL